MPDIAIRAEDLGKTYHLGEAPTFLGHLARLRGASFRHIRETLKALDGINFSIERGEAIGIIGRNGAGKSTLLKVLSRITAPTVGRADVYGTMASLLEVGTGFHPELTGRENIFLNGAILGMRKADIARHFDEIVDFAAIEKFVDTPVKRYSSGMYVRLAFSVAAHLQPDILIVDEVLAVGDTDFQKKCLGKMGDAGRTGRTVLFVSHNMAMVRQLTSRCILLDHGKIAFDGDSGEAIDIYSKSMSLAFKQGADLSSWPRQTAKQDRVVEFTSLGFDQETAMFEPNEPLRITAKMRAREAVIGVRLHGILLRADGSPVGSFFTQGVGKFHAGEAATFHITLRGLQLSPASYCFTMIVGVGGETRLRLTFDHIKEVLPFDVSETNNIEGTAGSWHPTWGSVRIHDVEIRRVVVSNV